MTPDLESVRKALLNARQAIQRSDRQAARGWAEQAVALDPDSEDPWLYLAALADPRESVRYLEQALRINPRSQWARKGMHWAAERLRHAQAESSLKQENAPYRDPTEDSGFARTLQDVSRNPADSKPQAQPPLQKNPAQTVARPAPSTGLHLPKLIAGYRWSRTLTLFSSRWQNTYRAMDFPE